MCQMRVCFASRNRSAGICRVVWVCWTAQSACVHLCTVVMLSLVCGSVVVSGVVDSLGFSAGFCTHMHCRLSKVLRMFAVCGGRPCQSLPYRLLLALGGLSLGPLACVHNAYSNTCQYVRVSLVPDPRPPSCLLHLSVCLCTSYITTKGIMLPLSYSLRTAPAACCRLHQTGLSPFDLQPCYVPVSYACVGVAGFRPTPGPEIFRFQLQRFLLCTRAAVSQEVSSRCAALMGVVTYI
jgi:hypothetical protein